MALGSSSSKAVELVFKGDNRSAVKALSGIAEQSEKTTRTLKTSADEQTVALTRVKDSTERLRGAFSGLAGLVGIGGLAFGLKDLVQGGVALQAQQAQLQAALNATGQAANSTGTKLQSYAEKLSTSGGFSTTENLAALTAFVHETHSATQAQQMLTLATNIARGRNIDLATAQTTVARAYTGSVGRLQQLLGPMVAAKEAAVGLSVAHQRQLAALQLQASYLKGPYASAWLKQQEINDHITAQQAALATLTDKHATAMQVLTAAQTAFAGSTSTFANTSAGKMAIFQHQLQNLTETLGKTLLPAFNALIGVLTSVVGWMSRNRGVILALIAPIGALVTAYGGLRLLRGLRTMALDLATALRLTGTAGEEGGAAAAAGAAEAEVAWKSFMVSTIVGIVLIGLVELIAHWKAVEKAVVSVWYAIEHAFSDVWNFIKDHWQLIFSILTGPIGAAVIYISTHFNDIKNAIVSVWHFIERVATAIFNALTFPFRKAYDFIKGLWGDLKSVVNSLNPFGGNFLGLAHGGVVPRHYAWGGTSGTDTVPAWLTPGEGILTAQTVSSLGGPSGVAALNSGQAPSSNVTVTPMPFTMKLDSRTVFQQLVHFALNEAARGPTSLVGGSLVTGGTGLPVLGAR